MYRLYMLILAVFASTVIAGCGSSSVTPAPAGNDPIVEVPGIDGDAGKTVTVTTYYPTPTRDGTGVLGDGQLGAIDYLMRLDEYDSGKDLSALTNSDREAVEATANAIAWFLYVQQRDNPLGTTPVWNNVFPWASGYNSSSAPARNVQAPTWLGLLQYLELYDLYDPADANKVPVNDLALADLAAFLDEGGFLGEAYDSAMAASDADANTSADRPFAYEVILLSRAANVFNNPAYQYMAESWFAEVTDEFTGAEFATRLISARGSLSLWDAGGYMWAATLTGYTEFVDLDSGTDVGLTALFTAVTDEDDGMLQEFDIRRLDWENVLYSGWDFTNQGWAFLPAPLSELKLYAALTPVADAFYLEALANLKGNDFRHRSYGYFGYDFGGRIYDDSQYNGYGLIGLGHADQNDFSGSDTDLLRVMDGALEWFNSRIGADIANDTDIDLDGNGDAGVVRMQFRGTYANNTGTFYYEVVSEALSGIVIGGEQFFRFPDIPLP